MKANYREKKTDLPFVLKTQFVQFNKIKYFLGILGVMALMVLIFSIPTTAQVTFTAIVDGSAEDTRINAVQEVSGGGYIMAGERDVSGTPSFCAYLAKTDANGGLDWASVIDGSSEDTRINALYAIPGEVMH